MLVFMCPMCQRTEVRAVYATVLKMSPVQIHAHRYLYMRAFPKNAFSRNCFQKYDEITNYQIISMNRT